MERAPIKDGILNQMSINSNILKNMTEHPLRMIKDISKTDLDTVKRLGYSSIEELIRVIYFNVTDFEPLGYSVYELKLTGIDGMQKETFDNNLSGCFNTLYMQSIKRVRYSGVELLFNYKRTYLKLLEKLSGEQCLGEIVSVEDPKRHLKYIDKTCILSGLDIRLNNCIKCLTGLKGDLIRDFISYDMTLKDMQMKYKVSRETILYAFTDAIEMLKGSLYYDYIICKSNYYGRNLIALDKTNKTLLSQDIKALGLSVRSANILKRNNINTIEELLSADYANKLGNLSGMGNLTKNEIYLSTLNEFGIKLSLYKFNY